MTQSKRAKPRTGLSQASPGRDTSALVPPTDGCQEAAALKHSLSSGNLWHVNALTGSGRFAEFFPVPDDYSQSIKALRDDLSEVPVVTDDGTISNPYEKIQNSALLMESDKALIWRCLSIVREAFRQADGGAADGSARGYQWNMNWKHTRAEIDQVLESARLLRLDRESTADAILASIFSDSVKNRTNFITHNVDGAYGGAQVLFNFLDPSDRASVQRVERIVQAVREHQIAPPEFMARAATIMISKKLKLPRFDPRTYQSDGSKEGQIKRDLSRIYTKIADPFNKLYLSQDLRTIDFSPAERELLAHISVKDWFVPHPDNPDARVAHAVIAGDHSINYNHPEGFAKIALIRGPDTEAFFEDSTVHDSLDSAVCSFTDSFRVLLPEVQPMAIAGLRRTQSAVARVTAIMREMFSGVIIGPKETASSGIDKVAAAIGRAHDRHPELFIIDSDATYCAAKQSTERAVEKVADILQIWFDEFGEIPYNPKALVRSEPGSAKLPFWNMPLVYPERDAFGVLNLTSLTELQRRQFTFAGRIRDIAVELLRAEQWIY